MTASDGVASDEFGFSVSIEGEYIVAGAIKGNSDKGAVYVFKRSGSSWTQEARITASDAGLNDLFGCSVDLDGEYLAIGACREDINSIIDQSAAYVFKRTGTSWAEEAKLVAEDPSSNDVFGRSVSIDDGYVIVGADMKEINGNNGQGAGYVFKASGLSWEQQVRLISSDGDTNDSFGYSVSISGDYIVIGSTGSDINGENSQGCVYVFRK